MNNLSDKYYKQYEQLINQIITSQHMTFFDKADLLEQMDEDLQEKLAQSASTVCSFYLCKRLYSGFF